MGWDAPTIMPEGPGAQVGMGGAQLLDPQRALLGAAPARARRALGWAAGERLAAERRRASGRPARRCTGSKAATSSGGLPTHSLQHPRLEALGGVGGAALLAGVAHAEQLHLGPVDGAQQILPLASVLQLWASASSEGVPRPVGGRESGAEREPPS